MNTSPTPLLLFVFIGGAFGLLGAIMAALITYNEYLHHYSDTKEPTRLALQAGAFTFVFFMSLCLVFAFVFPRIGL